MARSRSKTPRRQDREQILSDAESENKACSSAVSLYQHKKLADYKNATDPTSEDGLGYSFSNDALCMRLEGNSTLTPPFEQILIACVLHPVVANPAYRDSTAGRIEIFIWTFGTVVALSIQVLMLMQINQDKDAQYKPCDNRKHGSWLCIASNIALTAAVVAEVENLWTFHDWINRLPEWEKEKDEQVLNKLHCGFAMQKRVFELDDVEFAVTTISHGGVSWWYRRVMRGACSLQMLLALYVLCVGTAHICRADKLQELVENAMALLFILEIDDFMYRFLLTPATKRFFGNSVPSIQLLGRHKDERDTATLEAYLGRHFYGERHTKGFLSANNGWIVLRLVLGTAWVCGAKYGLPTVVASWITSFTDKLGDWTMPFVAVLFIVAADLVVAMGVCSAPPAKEKEE
jgi:hypothetical protein